MLKYTSPIQERKVFDNLNFAEISPIMKLIIRGKKKGIYFISRKVIKCFVTK